MGQRCATQRPTGPGTDLPGGWGRVDLEPGRRTFPPGHPDRPLVPCLPVSVPGGSQVAGQDAEERSRWLEQVRSDLWEGRPDAVIAVCQTQVNSKREEDPAEKAVTYFTNNRHRMDYPTYRAQGYQIGSGTVESAAKQIGTQRMKVPGASWNPPSARRVAKARAAFLSGQWDTIAQRRTYLPLAA